MTYVTSTHILLAKTRHVAVFNVQEARAKQSYYVQKEGCPCLGIAGTTVPHPGHGPLISLGDAES